METKDFLRGLSEGFGLSGSEWPVAEKVAEAFRELAEEVRIDCMGNCIALKKGTGEKRPVIMLAAHMDEIGLIVKKVDKGGFLRFTHVGGVDQRLLPAQEVIVHGRKDLRGIVGVMPPHLLSPADVAMSYKENEMVIDVGLPEEEVKELVEVGDLITFAMDFTELAGDRVSGKAMDDRAGVAALLETLKYLKKVVHTADVYCVATVQEEVGLRGAIVSTYALVPDIGVAIDVGFGDMPGQPEYKSLNLEKGPGILHGANAHPKLVELLHKVAGEYGIPTQKDYSPAASGTDAWAIQISQAGVPTAVVSIPLRYMHTPVETLSLGDIAKTGRLLAFFCAAVDNEFVEGLKWC